MYQNFILFFFWPGNIPLYGYTIFYLPIHQLMGICTVFTFLANVNNAALLICA